MTILKIVTVLHDWTEYNQFLNIVYFSANAFDISLRTNEEVCITRRNKTGKICSLPPELQEIRNLLSAMKNEITNLNNKVDLINERVIQRNACKKGMKFPWNSNKRKYHHHVVLLYNNMYALILPERKTTDLAILPCIMLYRWYHIRIVPSSLTGKQVNFIY